MNNTGAVLFFPEDALPDGMESTVAYIGLMENKKLCPELPADESLISHIVMCGPHGVRFKKPVILRLPHWAGSKKSVRNFRGRYIN